MSSSMETLRRMCLERGVSGIRGIGRLFRTYDDNGDRKLDKDELSSGLKDYGLQFSQHQVNELFGLFDKDQSGRISFDEFLEALRPPMSKSRLALIDRAFQKLDSTGDGKVTIEDIKKTYDVTQNDKFKSGTLSKEQLMSQFLKSFQAGGEEDDVITKEEFLNYYSGVSASIDEDVYFDYMMRQAWKL